jgi:hypothetical protein
MMKSRSMRRGACLEPNRSAYRDLVGNPEVKKTLERPRRRRENTTEVHLKETVYERCELDSAGSGEGPVAESC